MSRVTFPTERSSLKAQGGGSSLRAFALKDKVSWQVSKRGRVLWGWFGEGCVRAWDGQVRCLESIRGVSWSLMARALRGWGEEGTSLGPPGRRGGRGGGECHNPEVSGRSGANLQAPNWRVSHTHGFRPGNRRAVLNRQGQPSSAQGASEPRARGGGAGAGGRGGGGRAARVGVLLVAVVVALHLVPAGLAQVAHPALDAAAV